MQAITIKVISKQLFIFASLACILLLHSKKNNNKVRDINYFTKKKLQLADVLSDY